MTDGGLEMARTIAMTILAEKAHPVEDDLDRAVAGAVAALGPLNQRVDVAQLRRRLEAEVSILVGRGAMLEDNDLNHRPWLPRRRAEIDWRFWRPYREWMSRKLPPEVIRRLDTLTDEVLESLEDPLRPGPWDRRGMLVGQVQSGKTGNYTGLICKAADAGYNFIVVLAGLHNSLRSQTQRRLDEGFLGLDSRLSLTGSSVRTFGVASGRDHPAVQTLTSSDESGDFAKTTASRVAPRLDANSAPTLLVVKKHKSILNNLYEWITSTNGERDPDTGEMVVTKFPLLLIDDEADNASVNTKKVERTLDEQGETLETDPSEINKQIRRLLGAFDRSSLVSYTATPFANLFIDNYDEEEEREVSKHGEDLFPRSFILRMPPPTNYVGPAQVFGIPAGDDPEGIERPGLPVLRQVSDHEGWLPPPRVSDGAAGALPGSLKRAIRSFLLVCAARAARGQVEVHNSMLIHVTRFVIVQGSVREKVQSEVATLRDRILFGETAGDDLLEELRELWHEDFEPTSVAMPDALRGTRVGWEDVRERLPAAVGAIKVMEINGSARDALTYADHPDGLSVIAIGGDKLSRGLTLEGLSVSYYLRASKMYDTLMQMGRWFGYRDDYTDLIRLFTTAELQNAYRDITVANEELGAKFDEMSRVGSNPREFSLYVRKSPAGLMVTSHSKMRAAKTMELTYSGEVSETIAFDRNWEVQKRNLELVDRFLTLQSDAGHGPDGERHNAWSGVPGALVAGFLDEFDTADGATKARSKLLAKYIRSRLPEDELEEWTVVLINNQQSKEPPIEVAGLSIGLTERSHFAGRGRNEPQIQGDYTLRRLASPDHETLDLSDEEGAEAESRREEAWAKARALVEDPDEAKRPSIGPFARRVRPRKRGLLVLYCLDPGPAQLARPVDAIPGFLVSFPVSSNKSTITYAVPRRYYAQEAG